MNLGPSLWCLLAAALFGVSPAACRTLLGQIDPIPLASLLYLGAGLATLPFSVHKTGKKIQGTEWLRLIGAIFFGGVLGPILLMIGIEQSNAGTSSLLLNFETVATVVLGFLFFKEHIGRNILLASLCIVGAGIWLSFPENFQLQTGGLWVVAACFCWGIDNHLTAVIEQFSPAQSTCLKGICAGLFNLVLALLFSSSWGSMNIILGGLLIGMLCYGASIVLYISSAQQLGATRSQMIFASAPYWGLLCAWIFLAEPIFIAQLGAAVLMLLSLFLMHRERHGHKHTHRDTEHLHLHHHKDLHHAHEHPIPVWSLFGWHIHLHKHSTITHSHEHRSDIHHRHH
ncbi:MAG: DMT family transporter [Myxococcota bacterium]|nr:DMT family transporter [Myxococcota bacterium]